MVPRVFSFLQFSTLLYLFIVTFASTEEATTLLKWKATFLNQNNFLFASWTLSPDACRDCLNQLSGTIPPEIGKLTNLVYLDLCINQISSSIPPQIVSLTKLETLNIFDNHLNCSIPTKIGKLVNLVKAYLEKNQLSSHIPIEIGKMMSLDNLSLRTNNHFGPIPKTIGHLIELKALHLYSNQLFGLIPIEIGKMKSLEHLTLGKNSFSSPIPKTIGDLTELKILYLYSNPLSGPIPSELWNLKNLTELDLSDNQLTSSISFSLGDLTELKRFEANREDTKPIWLPLGFHDDQPAATSYPSVGIVQQMCCEPMACPNNKKVGDAMPCHTYPKNHLVGGVVQPVDVVVVGGGGLGDDVPARSITEKLRDDDANIGGFTPPPGLSDFWIGGNFSSVHGLSGRRFADVGAVLRVPLVTVSAPFTARTKWII
ncbi:probable leucine-rich repeat receptor-like protein kinase At1g35710 [Lycium ferocissimum]|uniref:probable leucine-rich repeat receptor-like protein kinase At1g35710 n=1 Tax=Lycium ferocissimum TaxID=112874 RepID=UPI0028155B16|nr:probable leucine-rich repeat receptor-like protein kinase At1g35710 [Lycium ferocissimum]